MKNIIIDLNEPNTWVNDFVNILYENKIKLPSYDSLCDWSCCDYRLSKEEQNLVNIIKENKIILYHGCKTFNPNLYYTNGMPIPDKNFYYNLFQTYIKELNFHLTPEQKLEMNLVIKNKKLENRIFTLLVPHPFKKECSSYIGLGSEWITYLFLKLLRKQNVYKMLYSIGKPTVFKILMPINKLEEYNRITVCGEILKCYIDNKDGYDYTSSKTVFLHEKVLPKEVISHFYINEFYSFHINEYVKIEDYIKQ